MKKRLVWLIVVVAAAGLVGGGVVYWNAKRTDREVLAGGVPSRPVLEGWPAELKERIESCEERVSSSLEVDALEELSRLYHANGFYAQATHCYAALERLQPREPTWLHRHAVILAGFGDAASAEALWKTVIGLAPRYTPARLRYGDTLLIQNHVAEAAQSYERVLEQEPGNAYASLGLARCEIEAGRPESALQLLETAVAETNYRLGYDLIVTILEELGQDSRAAAIRGKQKASGAYRDPFDPWMDVLFDDCYDSYRLSLAAGASLDVGKTTEAIQRLERALRFSPGNVSLHFQLGSTHLADGALTKAREQFKTCTDLDPEFPDGWAQLSFLYERLGDAEKAEKSLADGLAHCPNSPGLHLMKARRLKRARNLEAAIDSFETSIRLRPNEADAYLELATLYFESNRTAQGVATLLRGLEAEPDHPIVLSTLAYNAVISGDEREARRWMERANNQPRVPAEQMGSLRSAYRQTFGREWIPAPP